MPYYAFPAELVDHFNEALYSDSWSEETWAQFLKEMEAEVSSLGLFFRDTQDESSHEKLRLALSELSSPAPEGLPQLLEMAERTTLFIQYLGQYRQSLQGSTFVRILELDRLIVAAIATIQGRGNFPALNAYAETAFQRVSELAETFEELRGELSQEVQGALTDGFFATSQGFKTLLKGLTDKDLTELERAVIDLKEGASLLDHLYQWENQWKLSQSFAFPSAGAEAATLLKKGDMEAFRSGPLQDLSLFWGASSEMLTLPQEHESLLGDVDQLLADLESQSKNDALESCQKLEELFALIETKALSPGTDESLWSKTAQFLAVAAAEGVPDILILDVAAGFRDSPYGELRETGRLLGKEVEADNCREALSYLLRTPAPADLLLTQL